MQLKLVSTGDLPLPRPAAQHLQLLPACAASCHSMPKRVLIGLHLDIGRYSPLSGVAPLLQNYHFHPPAWVNLWLWVFPANNTDVVPAIVANIITCLLAVSTLFLSLYNQTRTLSSSCQYPYTALTLINHCCANAISGHVACCSRQYTVTPKLAHKLFDLCKRFQFCINILFRCISLTNSLRGFGFTIFLQLPIGHNNQISSSSSRG